jgi:hypothetical protein
MGRKARKRWLPWWLRKHLDRRERLQAVRRRDGDNCWRCHQPMRFGPPYNVGKAATVEHRQPKALGGTWELGNLRLCHVGCNRHLGANPPEQKERMRLRKKLDPGSSPG